VVLGSVCTPAVVALAVASVDSSSVAPSVCIPVVVVLAVASVDSSSVAPSVCIPVVVVLAAALVDSSSVAPSVCIPVDVSQLASAVGTLVALGLVDSLVACRPEAGQPEAVVVGNRLAVVDEVVALPLVADLRHDGRELPNLVVLALEASNNQVCTHTDHQNSRSTVAHKGSCLDVLRNGQRARPIRNCSNASSRRAKLHCSRCTNTLAPTMELVACEKHSMALAHQPRR
jgi:hypothetical protein